MQNELFKQDMQLEGQMRQIEFWRTEPELHVWQVVELVQIEQLDTQLIQLMPVK
jgi:hypothetical protein